MAPAAIAQNAPQGMKYQAIARDLDGVVLENQKVILKINLQSGHEASDVYYTEVHQTITNKFGLFSLVIGNGKVNKGLFKTIPWSSQDVWMSIAIMDDNTEEYKTISNSKLLAVPYAFHAGTASEVVNNDASSKAGPGRGVPSQNWSLFGNSKSNPKKDKLGTTDSTDVVFVTNNIERLRITADGEIQTGDGKFTIGGNLEVQGDSTTINKDLFVGRDVRLNYSDEFVTKGNTINHGDFTTEGYGQFDKNVTVKDTLFTRVLDTEELNIKADVEDGGFLAVFENTNSGAGDGINIKLGGTHPMSDGGSGYYSTTNPFAEYVDGNIENIEAMFTNGQDISVGEISELATELNMNGFIAGAVCGLLEQLVGELNEALDLPYNVRLPALCISGICIPGFSDPKTIFSVPEIPEDLCNDLGLPMLTMPNISNTSLATSLSNNNHFIDFSAEDGRTLGYVRAVTITEWRSNYFDGVFVSSLIQKSVGLDPLDGISGIINIGTAIADDYNKIGVEYVSGNGDYAEWLERLNPDEFISKGDIVGVIGGKITKDLENAEQIMAVSEQPIMLGNIPEKSKEYLGNNIAFMGQIPVKVIGEVNSGDYIIADAKIPGYGIAKNPSDVTLDDTKFIVGRSWQTNLTKGPKMVNTVIGVHNGDYLKIIKKFHTEFKQAEKRLDNLESKVDALINNSDINDSSLNN
jgi:hypothetical protein